MPGPVPGNLAWMDAASIIEMAGTGPAMTNTITSTQARLRLAVGLEHHRVDRLARRLAGPDHELECRVMAFAGVGGGRQHRLALLGGCGRPAGEDQRLAEHHQARLEPEVEMPDPELLVDQ